MWENKNNRTSFYEKQTGVVKNKYTNLLFNENENWAMLKILIERRVGLIIITIVLNGIVSNSVNLSKTLYILFFYK